MYITTGSAVAQNKVIIVSIFKCVCILIYVGIQFEIPVSFARGLISFIFSFHFMDLVAVLVILVKDKSCQGLARN